MHKTKIVVCVILHKYVRSDVMYDMICTQNDVLRERYIANIKEGISPLSKLIYCACLLAL